MYLSYDLTVIQWVRSYHKTDMTKCNITLGYLPQLHQAIQDSVMFSVEKGFNFYGHKMQIK